MTTGSTDTGHTNHLDVKGEWRTEDALSSKRTANSSAPIKKTEFIYRRNEASRHTHYQGLTNPTSLMARAK
jgi:hypothetical protein